MMGVTITPSDIMLYVTGDSYNLSQMSGIIFDGSYIITPITDDCHILSQLFFVPLEIRILNISC